MFFLSIDNSYGMSSTFTIYMHACLLRTIPIVASRPRFGGDSQVLSWYRPAEMKLSWIETSWKDSAGQGPARPKGSSYVYKYLGVTQVDSRQ
jgi:hypothetical protein